VTPTETIDDHQKETDSRGRTVAEG